MLRWMDVLRDRDLPGAFPFVETVRGNEAALALERVAKHLLRIERFDARVDHQRRFRTWLGAPERHQSPAHHLDDAYTVAQRAYRRRLRRRDVKARLPPLALLDIGVERRLQIFDQAVLARHGVPATHLGKP